jgi:hypothetical protein
MDIIEIESRLEAMKSEYKEQYDFQQARIPWWDLQYLFTQEERNKGKEEDLQKFRLYIKDYHAEKTKLEEQLRLLRSKPNPKEESKAQDQIAANATPTPPVAPATTPRELDNQIEAQKKAEEEAQKKVAKGSSDAETTPEPTSEETAEQEKAAQEQVGEGLNVDPNYDAYDYGAPPSTAAANENPEAKPLNKPILNESLNIGTRSKNNIGIRADTLLSDSQWVRNAFMMPSAQLDEYTKLNRFFPLSIAFTLKGALSGNLPFLRISA